MRSDSNLKPTSAGTSRSLFLYSGVFIIVCLIAAIWYFFSVGGVARGIKHLRQTVDTVESVTRGVGISRKYKIPADFFNNFEHRVWKNDGITQVIIPTGEYRIGKDEEKPSDHSPEHTVLVSEFWIDAFEVSNERYRMCVEDGGCAQPEEIDKMYRLFIFDDYPVVYVTWAQALAYCGWAGKDLPTEAEWEIAARGAAGLHYPWGNDRPTSGLTNFGNGVGNLVAVDTFPDGASPFGALNMSGNAREWVRDWFNPTYYQRSPQENPTGSPHGHSRSLRGGGFNDPLDRLMTYNRFSHDPTSPGYNRGFRCVSR